eukprot:CAMPEP_0117051890 /NCGR_PEP_ID=MMETSP0472-20121206/35859_1 /TAXON_ID=693140 ORGANISM="Tiarina fusus, Strain LIS" /NCGR_SAMPLE_ID=MMETSP0472 /ASSEMBLY_ACC=CAM_ASM_000603 /LENGTH=141 /DNA_ID=CAMNT_0004766289 /DNA_START=136 /DNA_END=558 /DNA_ORIENTATION=+
MKLFSALALAAFWAQSADSQNSPQPPPEQIFCGSQACLIDTPISCDTLIKDYIFQGSCCSLQPIPGIRGCRVEIKAGGNCFWLPECGVCGDADPSECNKIYTTTTSDACPASDFDPFANKTEATCPPTLAPTMAPEEDLDP